MISTLFRTYEVVMRGWFPDELVDEFEQMPDNDIVPNIAQAVHEAIDDGPDHGAVLILAVMKDRRDDQVTRMLFAMNGKFVQFDILRFCSCGSKQCALVKWGRISKNELKKLETGWCNPRGRSGLLCESGFDREAFLYGRASWIVNHTIH